MLNPILRRSGSILIITQGDHLSFGQHFLGVRHTLVAQFGDMDQTFQSSAIRAKAPNLVK